MCFSLSGSKLKIASKDIVVYKKLDRTAQPNKFKSPFVRFTYVLGEAVEVKWFVDFVSHQSFKIKIPEGAVSVDAGLHAYMDLDTAYEHWQGSETVECVIPKGTPYIENLITHEVVSLKLTPVKVL